MFPFEPARVDEWYARIREELKNQSPESLAWNPAEGVQISPFIHREERLEDRPPLVFRSSNNWEIAEEIPVGDPAATNQYLLQALNHGLEAPVLVFDAPPAIEALQTLLKGVEWTWVSMHFTGFNTFSDWNLFLDRLEAASPQYVGQASLHGSFGIPFHEDTLALASRLERSYPGFEWFLLRTDRLDAVEKLRDIIHQGAAFLEKNPSWHHRLQVRLEVGLSYFLEIATLRAFKMLWAQLMDGFDLPDGEPIPKILVGLAPDSFSDNPHTNMIRATTQALSAAIGGVDRLALAPSGPTDFNRQVARNLQHILKMESHIDWVIDPAAGSYYLENLSLQLAERAWG